MEKIIITTALPYANGDLHLGHALEHLITDFWARFHRMKGRHCIALSGDDGHGTAVMLQAKKMGLSPEAYVESAYFDHQNDLESIGVFYDYYGSTHTESNRILCHEIFQSLEEKDFLEEKEIEQFFCDHDGMFLPDRFVKGTCPFCKEKDQYGDNCEICSSVYQPLDLIDPYCSICLSKPRKKNTRNIYFSLEKMKNFLLEWSESSVPEHATKKLHEWLSSSLKDWCLTRDQPYFGFQLEKNKDKYYYVWFDAPIGYLSILQSILKCSSQELRKIWRESKVYHNIGKDIVYFHALFWPALLQASGWTAPSQLLIHGMLNINGEKMSKSKGTFIKIKDFLGLFESQYLRYYLASKLQDSMRDFDANSEDFTGKINADFVGKITNLGSRSIQMLHKCFSGRTVSLSIKDESIMEKATEISKSVEEAYERRDFSRAVNHILDIADLGNKFFSQTEPWKLLHSSPQRTQEILSLGAILFRKAAICLAPILPSYAEKVSKIFGESLYYWSDMEKTPHPLQLKPWENLATKVDPQKVRELFNG